MSLVLALSVLVSCSVFWFTRGIGTALTDEVTCGKEEHTHTEKCYEKTLKCEEDHEHTDECYEKKLTCKKKEHKHTSACRKKKNVKHETKKEWEATVPKKTGKYAKDIVKVAASQVGYKEQEDGVTRYGSWYGSPSSNWNVTFVSFCMHYSGISKKQIPAGSGCSAWQAKLSKAGLIKKGLKKLPKKGDILLVDNNNDGKCDRAGIIVDVSNGNIATVEGDVKGKVDAVNYSVKSDAVYGYVSVNALDAEDTKKTESPATSAAEKPATSKPAETTAPSEKKEKPAETKQPKETRKQTEKPSETEKVKETSKPEETKPAKETEPAKETDKPAETKPTGKTETPAETEPSGSTKKTEVAEPSGSSKQAEETAPSESTKQPEETEPSESTKPAEVTEPSESSDPSAETEPTESTEQTDETEPTESSEETEATEETEETSETSETGSEETTAEDKTVFNGVTASGVEVIAKAEPGVFPEGAKMTVTDVNDEKVIEQVEQAADTDKKINGSVAVDITFTDKDGNEVEPAEGKTVEVNIIIPEAKQLEGDEFSLFHVEDKKVTEVEDAQVSKSEAAFTADGFSIYIVTALGEKDKDKVHEYLAGYGLPNQDGYIPNSERYPFKIGIGENVTIVGDSNYSDIEMYIDPNYEQPGCITLSDYSGETEPAESGHTKVYKTITGVSEGQARLVLRSPSAGQEEYFYIRVFKATTDDHTIYIDSNSDHYTDCYVTVGDEITINSAYGIGTGLQYLNGSEQPITEAVAGEHIVQLSAQDNGDGTCTYKFLAVGNHTDSGHVMIRIADKIIRFEISQAAMLDHADIEIADNGLFTSSGIYCENGVLKKKVTQYQSFISDVNKCYLYENYAGKNDPANKYTRIYRGVDEDPGNDTVGLYSGATGFEHENYWQNPDIPPGSTQFELTSKYKRDSNGKFCDFSTRQFFYSEVDHATFDVEIELRPRHEIVYVLGANGWEQQQYTEVEYQEIVENGVLTGYRKTTHTASGNVTETVSVDSVTHKLHNQEFEFNRRAVIDALNKCPMNNGLDFTISASKAVVELAAQKELIGRDLRNNEFSFGIYDNEACTGTPLRTATNNASGTVDFSDFEFTKSGTYTYYIKEIKGTDQSIDYDPAVYKMVLSVNKNLVADITSFQKKDGSGQWNDALVFEFKNSVIFSLPETGGGGILPYFAVGTAMIGSAFILLMLRRRKEVDI